MIKYTEDIFFSIIDYVDDLNLAQIPLPKVIKSEYKPGKLFFSCEYAGENILRMVKSDQLENTISSSSVFDQIIDILSKAQSSKLFFDPHPKNFVLENGFVSYVDFTPPWTKKYFKIRLSVATDKEKKILTNFFKCMHYNELGYHLCGDLLKIDSKNYQNTDVIHSELLKKKLISNNLDKFLIHAKSIVSKESP